MINRLTTLLGSDNHLIVFLNEHKQLLMSSMHYNPINLAAKAGISRLMPGTSGSLPAPALAQYNGHAFRLIFEAQLPEEHEHYWSAEVLIGEACSEDGDKVTLNKDSKIRILVFSTGRKPMIDGKLNLFGLVLPVCNGETQCSLDDLRNGLTCKKISFSSPSTGLVKGRLSF